MRKRAIDPHVGAQVARLRKASRLSQEQLGKLVGITRQSVSQYERGCSAITTARLDQLARALRCRRTELLVGLKRRNERCGIEADDARQIKELNHVDPLRSLLDASKP